MRDDPISLLERELVEAAKRRVRPAGSATTGRRRSSGGAFAAVVLSGVAVAVALGALVSLRGHRAAPAPSVRPPAASVRGRQQLLDILGVLRRPQTKVDLSGPWFREAGVPFARRLGATVDRSLIRRATLTPWGDAVYLIPLRPSARTGRGRLQMEGVSVFVGSGGDCCSTATDLETSGDLSWGGAGRAFAGGSTKTQYVLVVPDDVARVEFYFPPEAIPAGGPVYHHSLAVTVPVRDNVAAVQVTRQCCSGAPATIWFRSNGTVVKRIGSTSPRPSPPRPGPETPLSRAAERNPSTPNRVWVTPSAGGPHTVFKVHFQVLLSGAGYSYALSGTRCPAVTLNGGDGGGTNDLRGRIWSDVVDAVGGQTWCPGTYHLSVAIMNRPGARPFGTAAFTVTR
jgi:hypothetical protein